MSEIQSIVNGQKAPIGFFRKSVNRKETIKYLVEVLLNRKNKDVLIPLTVQDFKDFNLYSFLVTYYKGSVRKAQREAYSQLFETENKDLPEKIILDLIYNDFSPPRGFWTCEKNKKLTLDIFVKETKLSPYKIKASDFKNFNLSGFLLHYFENSPYKAMFYLNPDLKDFLFYRINPQIWNNPEIRIEAIRYYLKLLKNKEINKNNLLKIGMKQSLLAFYRQDLSLMMEDVNNFK